MRKMTKAFMLFLMLAVLLSLSACSSGIQFKRKSNAKDDEIKFYGFEWLVEKSDVEKKFDQNFGKDTYQAILYSSNEINDSVITCTISYTGVGNGTLIDSNGREYAPLLWEIGGQETSRIMLDYLSTDKGKTYRLYEASIYYLTPSDDVFDSLRYKLWDLYTETDSGKTNDHGGVHATFNDTNNNMIVLHYEPRPNGIDPWLGLTYMCTDARDFIREQEEAKTKENSRNENPDL